MAWDLFKKAKKALSDAGGDAPAASTTPKTPANLPIAQDAEEMARKQRAKAKARNAAGAAAEAAKGNNTGAAKLMQQFKSGY